MGWRTEEHPVMTVSWWQTRTRQEACWEVQRHKLSTLDMPPFFASQITGTGLRISTGVWEVRGNIFPYLSKTVQSALPPQNAVQAFLAQWHCKEGGRGWSDQLDWEHNTNQISGTDIAMPLEHVLHPTVAGQSLRFPQSMRLRIFVSLTRCWKIG